MVLAVYIHCLAITNPLQQLLDCTFSWREVLSFAFLLARFLSGVLMRGECGDTGVTFRDFGGK